MKTVAFQTLGCKVNSYESEAMLRLFKEADYQEVNFNEIADVYVINTCTVTNSGDSKSRQMIRKAIRRNEQAIVCVVGCYSQMAPEEIEQIEGVNVILGTQHRNQIVDCVNEAKETGNIVVRIEEIHKVDDFEDLQIFNFRNTRAYLKIQDGCNNFCTYCIIPYARGRVRSRPRESVLKQAQTLVDNGYVELVLTGIHTAGYGEDLENYTFFDLLKELVKTKGLKRLRISSIECSQIPQEMIEFIGENNIVVDHLHIPIQSGCDATLQRMRRKYTIEEYTNKINAIRNHLPGIAITTDVIVGFPGETEEEFRSTYECIQKIGFTQLHVFPYSPRKNTPAAIMKDQVEPSVKQERVQRLIALSEELQSSFEKKQVGKTVEVLFETRVGEYLVGHSGEYGKVKVKTDKELIGKICSVIIESYQEVLLGRVV